MVHDLASLAVEAEGSGGSSWGLPGGTPRLTSVGYSLDRVWLPSAGLVAGGPALSWASCGRSLSVARWASDSSNAGLHRSQQLLPLSALQFPWISYSDLWTLAGCVAIEEMGGGFVPAGMAVRWCLLVALGCLRRPVALLFPSDSRPAIEVQVPTTSVEYHAPLHPTSPVGSLLHSA